MTIEYRAIRAQDIEAVREFLVNLGWERVRDARRFRTIIEGADRTVVAFEGDRVVGFARALCDGASNGYISMVGVAPDRRRQGIGRGLIERLTSGEGSDRITWILRAGHDSPAFWKRLGFEPSAIAMERVRKQ